MRTLLVIIEISGEVRCVAVAENLGDVGGDEYHRVTIGERPDLVSFNFKRLDFVAHAASSLSCFVDSKYLSRSLFL